MRIFLATTLITLALFIGAGAAINLPFWLKPANERLSLLWKRDVSNLKKLNKLPKLFSDIGEIELISEDARTGEWVDKVKIPFKKKEGGSHRLTISVLQWIENHQYGVVMEFSIFEIKTDNKVYELGRTYQVGFIW